MHHVRSAFAVWGAGIGTGLRTFPAEPRLGLKRAGLPVSYWRTAEFAYVWRRLDPGTPMRVLDVGSPKDLAAFLARRRHYEVVATDILPSAVLLSQRYARAQGVDGSGPGRVRSEVQDGRSLPYPDGSFDAAYSVSVLEHIPDDGDGQALRELVRAVRPGGLIVVTVPFDSSYRETFVDRSVYDRRQRGSQPVFYERHYDQDALESRLFGPSGAELMDQELWGEGAVRVERILGRAGKLRTALSPLEPLLSLLFLRRVEPGGQAHAMAAFFTLRKRGNA